MSLEQLSAKELVRYHNKLLGVKPIGFWKAKKSGLVEIIRQLENHEETPAVTKKTRTSSVRPWAEMHHMNPKVVRAKMRRAGFNAPYALADIEMVCGEKNDGK